MNRVSSSYIFKGESFRAMGRVLGSDGEPLKQSDIASIQRTVAGQFKGVNTQPGPTDIDPAASVFDVPRMDAGWTELLPWNFIDVVPKEIWELAYGGLNKFQLVYTFIANDDFGARLVFDVYVQSLRRD